MVGGPTSTVPLFDLTKILLLINVLFDGLIKESGGASTMCRLMSFFISVKQLKIVCVKYTLLKSKKKQWKDLEIQ